MLKSWRRDVTVPATTKVNGFSTPSPLSASVLPMEIVSEPVQTAPVFNVTVKVVQFWVRATAGRTVRPGWPTVKCVVLANGVVKLRA